jgi:hypothetical protein
MTEEVVSDASASNFLTDSNGIIEKNKKVYYLDKRISRVSASVVKRGHIQLEVSHTSCHFVLSQSPLILSQMVLDSSPLW